MSAEKPNSSFTEGLGRVNNPKIHPDVQDRMQDSKEVADVQGETVGNLNSFSEGLRQYFIDEINDKAEGLQFISEDMDVIEKAGLMTAHDKMHVLAEKFPNLFSNTDSIESNYNRLAEASAVTRQLGDDWVKSTSVDTFESQLTELIRTDRIDVRLMGEHIMMDAMAA